MARTNKKGLDYFPMNVDFFEDDKIQLIESEFGCKGSNIALRLLCKIYKVDYFYQWGSDQCLLFVKSMGNGVVPNLVNEVVKGLVKRGFFDETVFNSFGVLTSKGIQNRYFDAIARYKKVDVIKEYLLIDVSKMINVNINSINVDINSINVNTCTHNESESESDNVSESITLIPTHKIYFIDIEKIEDFLISDQLWCEVICMQNHITIIQLETFIKSFIELLKSRGETGKTLNDAKSHFANWFKCEQSKKQKNGNNRRNLETTKSHASETL